MCVCLCLCASVCDQRAACCEGAAACLGRSLCKSNGGPDAAPDCLGRCEASLGWRCGVLFSCSEFAQRENWRQRARPAAAPSTVQSAQLPPARSRVAPQRKSTPRESCERGLHSKLRRTGDGRRRLFSRFPPLNDASQLYAGRQALHGRRAQLLASAPHLQRG